MNKDYMFYLNWEDNEKNIFKVGYLAQIEKEYYLVIRSDERNSENSSEKSVYDRGFIGIPGFISGRIYKSPELFDFFKNRILHKDSKDPCSELTATEGKSMIDSFSLEPISDILMEKQKENLLQAYKKQQELKELKDKKQEDTEISA